MPAGRRRSQDEHTRGGDDSERRCLIELSGLTEHRQSVTLALGNYRLSPVRLPLHSANASPTPPPGCAGPGNAGVSPALFAWRRWKRQSPARRLWHCHRGVGGLREGSDERCRRPRLTPGAGPGTR
jgi:hypothetical protein